MPTPPKARKVAHTHKDNKHGLTRKDPYHWLRADNWRDVLKNPATLPEDIRAYLEAENDYTKTMLADTEKLQDSLFAEMKARIKEDDSSVPAKDGDWYHYTRTETGKQYSILCRKHKSLNAKEEVILDVNELAEGHDFCKLGSVSTSPDDKWLAYSLDTNGSERFKLFIKNLETGEVLPDVLDDVYGGSIVWFNDNEHLLFTVVDEDQRPVEVRRYKRGDKPHKTQLVYKEKQLGFFLGIGKTTSERFIVINAHAHDDTAVSFLIDANKPHDKPRVVVPRRRGIDYSVDDDGEKLIIRTNWQAPDGRIMTAPANDPKRANWRDYVAPDNGCTILGFQVFKHYFAWMQRVDGLPQIWVRERKSGKDHQIALSDEVYGLGIGANLEFDSATLRITYSSPTTPSRVYDYGMKSRKLDLLKEQEVPSGHNPDDYVSERLFATAADGTRVPISLVRRKDTPLDGSAPLLLYGYGSYGMTIPQGFSPTRLSLLNRGFIYAHAHIRGGTDCGQHWHDNGKLQNKKNTFSDFIACGDHLVNKGYVKAGNIVAHGGSAGGMLMGAVANMRPDLFKGIVAQVPFVDCLTTICDPTLPLTPPEWVEWGNPIEDEDVYHYMANYSPYDNVARQAYPNILITAGVTDPRVTYWEPAKWCAKLRELKTDDNLLVMHMNMGAGHGGASGRFDALKEVALVYAFMLKITNKA